MSDQKNVQETSGVSREIKRLEQRIKSDKMKVEEMEIAWRELSKKTAAAELQERLRKLALRQAQTYAQPGGSAAGGDDAKGNPGSAADMPQWVADASGDIADAVDADLDAMLLEAVRTSAQLQTASPDAQANECGVRDSDFAKEASENINVGKARMAFVMMRHKMREMDAIREEDRKEADKTLQNAFSQIADLQQTISSLKDVVSSAQAARDTALKQLEDAATRARELEKKVTAAVEINEKQLRVAFDAVSTAEQRARRAEKEAISLREHMEELQCQSGAARASSGTSKPSAKMADAEDEAKRWARAAVTAAAAAMAATAPGTNSGSLFGSKGQATKGMAA